MKSLGRLGAVLGVVLAAWLVEREGVDRVLEILRTGGSGLIAVAFFHVVPMICNARAWQFLMVPPYDRPLPEVVAATWIRESINGLLPVARVGGEVASYRALTRRGADPVPLVASLVVDMVVSMLSQSVFTLVGIGLALHLGVAGKDWKPIAGGFVVLFLMGGGFVLLLGSTAINRLLVRMNQVMSQGWRSLLTQSLRLDGAIGAIYARPRQVVLCIAWQLAGWLLGAAEIWLTLVVLDHRVPFEVSVVIEAAVQTVSSVAFAVPGAYGVQEGAFLLIGAALGMNGIDALALALTRRLRDVIVLVPGLLAWSWFEMRGVDVTRDDRSKVETDLMG